MSPCYLIFTSTINVGPFAFTNGQRAVLIIVGNFDELMKLFVRSKTILYWSRPRLVNKKIRIT